MKRVLVVDDDKDIQFLLGEYLEASGFEVEVADSPPQARRRLRGAHFDVIVSDYQMGFETGLDLFRYVSSRYPGLPFIMMTGSLDSRVRREALRMGITEYLEKPFHMVDLIRIIKKLPVFSERSEGALASTA